MANNRGGLPPGFGGLTDEERKKEEAENRQANQAAWEKRKYVSDYYNANVLRRAPGDGPYFVPLTTKEKEAHANDPNMAGQGVIAAGAEASAFPKYDYYKVRIGQEANGNPIFSKEFDILYDKDGVRPASNKIFHGEFDKEGWGAALDMAVSELRYQSIRISVAAQPQNPKDARRHIQAMIELCAEKKIPVDVEALKNLPFLQQLSAKDRHALIEAAQATESNRDYMMMMAGVADKKALQNYQVKFNLEGKLEGSTNDKKIENLTNKVLQNKQGVALSDTDEKLQAIDAQMQVIETRLSNVADIHARLDEGVSAEKKLINDPDAQIKSDKLVNPVVSAKGSWFSTANDAFKKSIQNPTDQDRREFLNAMKKTSTESAEQRGYTYNAMQREIDDLKLRNEACEKMLQSMPSPHTQEQTAKIKAMQKQIDDRTTDLTAKTTALAEMRKWDHASDPGSRGELIKTKQQRIDEKEARQQQLRT